MVAGFTTTDDAIRAAHKRRLARLELRAAQQGYSAPPEVLDEITDIKDALAALAAPQRPPETDSERYEALTRQINGLALLITETREEAREEARETRRDVRMLFVFVPILMVLLCGFMVLLVNR